jgi:hypothetical protein
MERTRRSTTSITLATLLLMSFVPALPARAWSNKEHIQLTRLAAERVVADPQTPAAMKEWLRAACPQLLSPEQERDYFLTQRIGLFPRGVDGLAYWATVPDMLALTGGSGDAEKKVEPFGVGEAKLHYVDLEYFIREESNRRYRHDLKNKPFLFDIPLDMKDERWKRAGMLPFRVEQCYGALVKAISAGRLVDKPGQFPRDEHATKWAGFLAHYLEDNTQPQHATEDYKSRAYFADKRTSPNVHADVEYRLMDDDEADYMELRKAFWDVFARQLDTVQDTVTEPDLRKATLEVSLASYDALPLIGLAAMKAYGQGGTPEMPEGKTSGKFDADAFYRFRGTFRGADTSVMEMKAYQMVWAVKRVERLWRRAWDEAQRPAHEPSIDK